jgi:hypothetical protein
MILYFLALRHDWGSQVCYEAARMRPDIFTAVIGAVVPVRPRSYLVRIMHHANILIAFNSTFLLEILLCPSRRWLERCPG